MDAEAAGKLDIFHLLQYIILCSPDARGNVFFWQKRARRELAGPDVLLLPATESTKRTAV
jgi:hypothetical protein